MKCKCDSSYLFSLAHDNITDLTMRTPKLRSLYCENHQLAMVLNTASRPHFKHIHILAAIFAEKKMCFDAGQVNLKRFSIAIGEKLLKYSHEYGCLNETKVELQ
jgi:hypothetical protein